MEGDRLQELRRFINLRAKSPTPITSDRGTRNGRPITFSSTPLSEVIPLPLSEVIDEGIPSENISLKVLPQSPLTPQGNKMGQEQESKQEIFEATNPNSLLYLSQQLAQSLTDALKPVLESLIADTKSVLLEIKERSPLTSQGETKFQREQPIKSPKLGSDNTRLLSEPPETAKTLEQLVRLVAESVESLRLNPNLTAALSQHPDNVAPAMLYFKQAVATWKKKPGLGLFISALKKGLKPSPTALGGGWGDWANEATKRRLMQYSQSHDGDIMVHFVSGIQKLWSEVRHLDWGEIEALVVNPSS